VSPGAPAAARKVVKKQSKPHKQQDGQRSHTVISPSEAAKNDVQCVPLRRLPVVVTVPPRGMGRQFASSVLHAARRRAPTQGDGKGPG